MKKKKPTIDKAKVLDKNKKPDPKSSGEAKAAAKKHSIGGDKKKEPKKASPIQKSGFMKAVAKSSKDGDRKVRNKGRH